MDKPIVPTASNLLTPYIDAIVAARPETLQHFNSGCAWSTLPAMHRAQLLVCLTRLAKEVKASRLRFATGEELRTLCASEFSTVLPPEPQTAIGKVTCSRTWTSGPALPAGVLAKQGDVWTRKADPNASPLPIQAATYEVAKTVYAPEYGTPGIPQSIDVPLVARAPGVSGNVPSFVGPFTVTLPGPVTTTQLLPIPDTTVQPTIPLLEGFTLQNATAAGGSSGITDAVLIAAAKAYAKGQFGATDDAIVASILRSQAARHLALLPANDAVPYDRVYVADESWASSDRFVQNLHQSFVDNFQGFGCRVFFGPIVNRGIGLQATINLKASDDLTFTDEIETNVRAAAAAYFDGRSDFYLFRYSALQAALSAADPRIEQCTSVSVFDVTNQAPTAEPTNPTGTVVPALTHWNLLAANVALTFQPPNTQ